MIGGRPDPSEYPEYYQGYVSRVPDGPVLDFLASEGVALVELLRGTPSDKAGHRYAPGKWSVREVVAHVIDAERQFVTRALAFARGDQGPYPSFDENRLRGDVRGGGQDAGTIWPRNSKRSVTRPGCSSRHSPKRPGPGRGWPTGPRSTCGAWPGSSPDIRHTTEP